MARALIVGCGCRGRALGRRLRAQGWAVRGTTRHAESRAAIEEAGIEAAVADPDRPGTVLDLVADVTAIHWLMGSALGEPELIATIHGPRLERLLERLVDTPVRGFIYEAGGPVPVQHLDEGSAIVKRAAERWRIPVGIVSADPRDHDAWLEAMATASGRLVGEKAG